MQAIYNKHFFTEFETILTNYTVTVDKYMNNSNYIFFGFLYFTVDLYLFEPLKRLLTFASVKSIDTIDSLFLWMFFLFFSLMYL